MSSQGAGRDRELERQGRRMGRSGVWWLLLALVFAVPGALILLVGLVAGLGWLWPVGTAVLAIGGGLAVVGLALLISSAVSYWTARRRLFA